jgi:hypothetical protein
MLKRLFVFVVIGALFFVSVQFISVFFSAFAFDDFVKDEVRYAPVRENDTKEHLVEHILEQSKFYRVILDESDIHVNRSVDKDSGVTTLSVDLTYTSPVDLYYFTYEIRRHLHAQTKY